MKIPFLNTNIIRLAVFAVASLSLYLFYFSLPSYNPPPSQQPKESSETEVSCGMVIPDMGGIYFKPRLQFRMGGYVIPINIGDIKLKVPSEYLTFSDCAETIDQPGRKQIVVEKISKSGLFGTTFLTFMPELAPLKFDFKPLFRNPETTNLISISIQSPQNANKVIFSAAVEDKETALQEYLKQPEEYSKMKMYSNSPQFVFEQQKISHDLTLFTQKNTEVSYYVPYALDPAVYVQRDKNQKIIRLFTCWGQNYEGPYNICTYQFHHQDRQIIVTVEFNYKNASEIGMMEEKIKSLINGFLH